MDTKPKTYLVCRRGYWHMRFRVAGQIRSVSTRTKSRATAKRMVGHLLETWLARNNTKIVISEPIDKEIERYMSVKYAFGKEGTTGPIIRHLKRMKDILGANHLQDITTELFESRVAELRGTSSPKTWAMILTNCRKFLKWAVDRGYIPKNPTHGIPTPPRSQFGRRNTVWTQDEFEAVFGCATSDDRDVLLVMRYTGMDPADIYHIERQHIRSTESGLKIVKRREKAKTELEVIEQPVSKKALPVFETRLASCENPTDRLFPAETDPTHWQHRFLDRMKRIWVKLKKDRKDLKSLRHTFASYHAERGVPMDVLRAWMGHSPYSRILESLYIHRSDTSKYMD